MTGTVKAGVRAGRSFRMWDGSYEDLKQAGKSLDIAHTTLVGDVMEVMLGYVRCTRCSMPVPVEFGDLTGLNPLEEITDAVRKVHAQRCWAYEGVDRVKRPVHRPVVIGVKRRSQPPSASGTAGEAATREQDAQGRTEPPAPVPAGRAQEWRDYAAARSDESVAKARSLATVPAPVGPAAVFRSFDPADEPHTTPAVPVPAVPDRAKRGLKPKCGHVVAAGTRCKICEPR